MVKLKEIIERTDTSLGKAFALTIQFLILVSIVAFSIETVPDLSENSKFWLWITELVIVLIFTFEYILRLTFAEDRLRFATSFFGVIDLLSILPFYLSTGVDLRSVRAFRLLRLFRIFKLTRYSKAMQRFHRALLLCREELVLYVVLTAILLFLSSVGIYYCENETQPEKFSSVFKCLWWSVATLTTVGYGDVFPVTIGGKIFTFFVLLVGLGVVAVPAGLVSSALIKAREMDD